MNNESFFRTRKLGIEVKSSEEKVTLKDDGILKSLDKELKTPHKFYRQDKAMKPLSEAKRLSNARKLAKLPSGKKS